MLVTSGLCTSQVEATGQGPVIPDRGDGIVHWPMSVVSVARPEGAVLIRDLARPAFLFPYPLHVRIFGLQYEGEMRSL